MTRKKIQRSDRDVQVMKRSYRPGEVGQNYNTNDAFAEEFRPRIPPGEYDAICYKAETGRSWQGRRDFYLRFRIEGGRYAGVELFMVGPYPRGKISRRTKFYEQWMLAAGRAPAKGERMTLKSFTGRLYLVLVHDTKCKFKGTNKLKPAHCQYSVVSTILESQTGATK